MMSDNSQLKHAIASEAATEKTYAAEKSVSQVRTAVIIFNSIVYLLLMDSKGTVPWLAFTIIFVANAYAAFVLFARPYRKYPVFLASYFTYGTDALLITLWIIATGGFESPFYVLWYISLIAVAFRFSSVTILFTAFLYTACYLFMLAAIGELGGHHIELTVRIGYIFLVAWLSILVSRETLQQTVQKKQMQRLAQEARQAGEQLSRQTRLYETLLKAQSELGEGVSITEDARFVYVNDALCRICGCSEEELMSTSILDLFPSEERSLLAIRLNEASAGKSSTFSGSTVMVNKNGDPIHIDYSVKVIETDGKPQIFSIIRDVTDEVESKKALEQTNIDLERTRDLERKKDEFIGLASHELKTPLTSLKGYVQLLQRTLKKENATEAARGYAEKTHMHIDKLNRLVTDLLDVSRINTGKLQFHFEEVNIGDIVEEQAESIGHTSLTHSVLIKNVVKRKVKADRVRLEQVITNLLTNAIKYSQGADKVIVDMAETADEVIVVVQDFGPGIPEEFLDKIFDRFFRVENNTKVPGLGIGLFISSEIIKRHGGRIWVESHRGQGTSFYFSLPAL